MNKSNFYSGMFDVSNKIDTLRSATAQSSIKVTPASIELIKKERIPKGNVVESAKISAVLGVKKTWELIPYCHHIPIDHVHVHLLLHESKIEITVRVESVWKTGVEMEALTGCSLAALTVYDMLKPIDENLSIERIRLLEKTGGKNDYIEDLKKVKVAIFVISDSTFKGKRVDKSGKMVINRLQTQHNNTEVMGYEIMPDDINIVKTNLVKYSDEKEVDLIITVGGTGFSKRDVTPEATKLIIERETEGISEAIRSHGQRRTPLSMFSRGISGLRGKTLIINLPGSTKGVSQSLDLLLPSIFHSINMINGKGHQ